MKRQLVIALFAFLLLPLLTLAAEGNEPNTFATIPFLSGNNFTTQGFVTALYQMAIGLAAVLVVVRLIMAGAKYMLSEVVSSKGDAKEDIKGALLGLLIILGAVLILGTINPKLVGLNVLNNGNSVELTNPDNNTQPPLDNINFKPGDLNYTRDGIGEKYCKTGSGFNEQCINENVSKIETSCKNNGGTFKKTAADQNIYGSEVYACN